MPTPLLLVSDAPFGTSGLSRICTDLYERMLWDAEVNAAYDVKACGHRPWPELTTEGQLVLAQDQTQPERWEFHDPAGWGAQAIGRAYRYFYGARPGVVWTIWDVLRCFEISQTALPVKLWGYFPVDGETAYGTLPGGSMAAKVINAYQRVLAYTEYGSKLLHTARWPNEPIPHLPHGLDLSIWHPLIPGQADDAARWASSILNKDGLNLPVIGCVATNNARKDLALVFRTWHLLKARGVRMRLWLHVDRLIGDWNIPVLAEDAGISPEELVLTNTLELPQLAALYASCLATIAPGMGEGFGYPIVESLACGTPTYHVNYAGGAEFTPRPGRLSWARSPLRAPYGTLRPVVVEEDLARNIKDLLDTAEQLTARYTVQRADAVDWVKEQGLDWTDLWPRWRQWILEGAN